MLNKELSAISGRLLACHCEESRPESIRDSGRRGNLLILSFPLVGNRSSDSEQTGRIADKPQ